MKRLFATLVCATVGVLGLANSAFADVRDNGRLFTPETVTEARTIIKDIEAKFKHSVTVETFATIPDDKKAAFDKAKKSKTDVEHFYQQWVQDRAKAAGARGLFILISKTPGHVEVLPDRETRAHEFTNVDAQDLARQLVNDFKDKKFDSGLIAGLDSVRNTMQAHHRVVRQAPIAKPSANPEFKPEHPTEKGHSIMGTICVVIGIVLLFWVIIGLIRSFTGAGRPPMQGMGYQGGPPGYAPMGGGFGGGGGGFFNNFLGGMFGAVAGNWMYNSFFGGGHSMGGGWDSPAYGGDRSAGGDFGGDAGAGDFSGGGGAGGDFGGDDAGGGGGDFGGGGDVGGGGGDWGGGGGDWGGGGGDFGGDSGGGGDF